MPKGYVTATDEEIVREYQTYGIRHVCRKLHVGIIRCRKVLNAAGARHGEAAIQ